MKRTRAEDLGSRVVSALAVIGLLIPSAAIAQRVEQRFQAAPAVPSVPAPVVSGLADTHARTGLIVGGASGAFAVAAMAGLGCLALDGSLVDCGVGEAARAMLTGGAIGGAAGGVVGFLIGLLIPRSVAQDGGDS